MKCKECNGSGEVVSDYCECGEPVDGGTCDNHSARPMIDRCDICNGSGEVVLRSFELSLKLCGCEKVFTDKTTGEEFPPGVVATQKITFTLPVGRDTSPMFHMSLIQAQDDFLARHTEVLTKEIPAVERGGDA